MSVSPSPFPLAPCTISPKTIAPSTAPRKAPTIPCQKRSGRKTVKCQRAMPMMKKTTRAIELPPPVLAPGLSPGFALGVPFAPLGRGFVAVAASVGQRSGPVAGRVVVGPLRRGNRSRSGLGGGFLRNHRCRRFALVVAAEFGQLDVVRISGDAATLDLLDPQATTDEPGLAFFPGG